MNPDTLALLRELVAQYNEEKALVLADWAEEHGFVLLATDLRAAPTSQLRRRVDSLALLVDPDIDARYYPLGYHWQSWLPGHDAFGHRTDGDPHQLVAGVGKDTVAVPLRVTTAYGYDIIGYGGGGSGGSSQVHAGTPGSPFNRREP